MTPSSLPLQTSRVKQSRPLSLSLSLSPSSSPVPCGPGVSVVRFLARAARLRTRDFLTRHNRLRLRYVLSGFSGLAVVMGLYAGGQIQPSSVTEDPLATAAFVASLDPSLEESIETGAGTEGVHELLRSARKASPPFSEDSLNLFRDSAGQIRRGRQAIESVEIVKKAEETPSGPRALRLQIGKGETLAGVLGEAGLDGGEVGEVVKAVSRHFNLKSLRAGQVLDLRLEPEEGGEAYNLSKVSFVLDPIRTLHVERTAAGGLSSRLDEKKLTQKRESRRVVIDGSVYGSADRAGLPDSVTASAIRLFSYAVDFQRDVRPGDRMEVMYDNFQTADGTVAKTGDIVFARMVVGGKDYTLFRYKTKDGHLDYFTPEGKSLRKSSGLMKTPVAFGRMSSGYGVRVHPVLGYTKMHKGVDFAAPTGTPIFAAGDGVIERASRYSSYGNYIRLRHSAKLSSAYGHLSRYAKGIRPGVRIKQGQVIGYVGTTGRSTGPHLHYEILVNGVQVNPRSVKFAVDNSLKGGDMKKFRQMIRRMDEEYAKAIKDRVVVASAKE